MERLNFRQLIIASGLLSFGLVVFLTAGESKFWNATALGGLMVLFWLFEVIPIYVTALFPFVLGIPLGVLNAEDLTNSYGHKYIYLFLGGFMLSLALEKWHVHRQIADRILHLAGTSRSRILLGFLLSTALLSMWISNTATALMMLPMATAILSTLELEKKSRFSVFLLLSVAYGSNIGGMMTLVGSPPNVQMAGILESRYQIDISFVDWMLVGIPVGLGILLLTFLVFYVLMGKERGVKIAEHSHKRESWSNNQFLVLALFLVVVILWAFRPFLVNLTGVAYTDEGVAVFGSILLFFLPSNEKKPLLEWKDTAKLPWGILLLFGGGMALATMLEKNGIIELLTEVFSRFSDQPYWVLLMVLVAIAIFATELMSNLALVSVFVPLVAGFASDSGLPILELCMGVTLAASCAFMLPVGTPPNAIVFSAGIMRIDQMAKVGFVLNVLSVLLISLLVLFLL